MNLKRYNPFRRLRALYLDLMWGPESLPPYAKAAVDAANFALDEGERADRAEEDASRWAYIAKQNGSLAPNSLRRRMKRMRRRNRRNNNRQENNA